jgi:Flp pilus assembly protein TadG
MPVKIASPSGAIRFPAPWPSGFIAEFFAGACPHVAMRAKDNGAMRRGKGTRSERGLELLEFALVLPLLLVLVVGIFDFGAAFALRQKMTNAAREGARIVVSSSLTDQSCTSKTPCSIVAGASAVVQYMDDAGASLSCVQPSSPTSSGPLEWTYACSNGTQLVINRAYTIAATGGGLLPATQVTLTYPITWRLASFLPGYANGAKLSTEVTMANLVD